jgi:DNA-binding SARP family transcriptional activator
VALEGVLGRSTTSPCDELPGVFREAAALYRGHFLPADRDREWAVTRGELLRNRFLALVVAAARHFEGRESWQSAADCYLRGLDADDLVEELYARLMLCYQRLGRRSEAVQVYRRCRHVLANQLGIAPSAETEAILASLHEAGGLAARARP